MAIRFDLTTQRSGEAAGGRPAAPRDRLPARPVTEVCRGPSSACRHLTQPLTLDGCARRPSFATLEVWSCQTDSYLTPSAGRRSSIRRSWRSFSANRTPQSTEPWPTCWPRASSGGRATGTAHLPSSQRYYLTANGVPEVARVLGFETPSDFVRAYPVSRKWLTLLIRRMDAVGAVYRVTASLFPGIGGLRSRVEFYRRGRFDATITLHDGRTFGVAPGPGPQVSLRPAEGHSGVRLHPPS